MGEPLDPKETVSFKELLIMELIETQTIAQLLIEKGIITKEEYLTKLTLTYAQRLWDFFRELFSVSFAAIFNLFKIEEEIHTYIGAVNEILQAYPPIGGCET